MSPIEVRPAVTPADLDAFIRLPFRLYQDSDHWVPPLLLERREFLAPRRNPVFEYARIQLFLAWRAGEVVGTIAAVKNDRYGAFHPDEAHVGFFGLYECVPDQAVADALFAAAAGWLRAEGKTVLRGPVSFTTNDVAGLLVEGFDDDPALGMPYNPPGYADQMEAAGFVKVKDLYAFHHGDRESERLVGLAGRLAERSGCSIRPMDPGRYRQEMTFVRDCYNAAWAGNWGFVPWTDREFEFTAKTFKQVLVPPLALVAEREGAPVGFMISVPDANEAFKRAHGRLLPFGLLRILWKLKVEKCNRIRIVILGVLPQHRRLGLDVLLIHHTFRNGIRLGYKGAEMGWVAEDNSALLGPLRQIGVEHTKTYRVYDRPII